MFIFAILFQCCTYLCSMKVVRFVLAIYILLMAVYPCSDSKTCLDEQRLGTVITTADHDHEPQEKDLCTPFCICTCCAAHVQLTASGYSNLLGQLHNTEFATAYLDKPILSSAHSIWQPPRI